MLIIIINSACGSFCLSYLTVILQHPGTAGFWQQDSQGQPQHVKTRLFFFFLIITFIILVRRRKQCKWERFLIWRDAETKIANVTAESGMIGTLGNSVGLNYALFRQTCAGWSCWVVWVVPPWSSRSSLWGSRLAGQVRHPSMQLHLFTKKMLPKSFQSAPSQTSAFNFTFPNLYNQHWSSADFFFFFLLKCLLCLWTGIKQILTSSHLSACQNQWHHFTHDTHSRVT